jgi:hypothetical protein
VTMAASRRNAMSDRNFFTCAILCSLLIVAAFSGCGRGGPAKAVVIGEVHYNGAPLPNGEIRFVPTEGTTGPVSGGTIADGKYSAEGKGGVPLGKHRVEIRSYRPIWNAGANRAAEGGGTEQFLPSKYNGESTLTATVSAESAATPINFDLQGS